jgi:hypothetical protein
MLEAIHLFVEILDVYFGNVCELDLVFRFDKVSPLFALCIRCDNTGAFVQCVADAFRRFIKRLTKLCYLAKLWTPASRSSSVA